MIQCILLTSCLLASMTALANSDKILYIAEDFVIEPAVAAKTNAPQQVSLDFIVLSNKLFKEDIRIVGLLDGVNVDKLFSLRLVERDSITGNLYLATDIFKHSKGGHCGYHEVSTLTLDLRSSENGLWFEILQLSVEHKTSPDNCHSPYLVKSYTYQKSSKLRERKTENEETRYQSLRQKDLAS